MRSPLVACLLFLCASAELQVVNTALVVADAHKQSETDKTFQITDFAQLKIDVNALKKFYSNVVTNMAVATFDCASCLIATACFLFLMIVQSLVIRFAAKGKWDFGFTTVNLADYVLIFAFFLSVGSYLTGCNRHAIGVTGFLLFIIALLDLAGFAQAVGKTTAKTVVWTIRDLFHGYNLLYLANVLRSGVFLQVSIPAIVHAQQLPDKRSSKEGGSCALNQFFTASCQPGLLCNKWSQCSLSIIDPYFGPHVTGHRYSQWMKDPKVADLDILHVFFLGTHHSGHNIAQRDIREQIMDIHLIDTCQQDSLWSQLLMGVRYFDFRLAYSRNSNATGDDRFDDVHGLSYGPIKPKLQTLVEYVNDYPSEFLMVNCGNGDIQGYADAIMEPWPTNTTENLDLCYRVFKDHIPPCGQDVLATPLKELGGKILLMRNGRRVCCTEASGCSVEEEISVSSYQYDVSPPPAGLIEHNMEWLPKQPSHRLLEAASITLLQPAGIAEFFKQSILQPFDPTSGPAPSLGGNARNINEALMTDYFPRLEAMDPKLPHMVFVDFVNDDMADAVMRLNGIQIPQ